MKEFKLSKPRAKTEIIFKPDKEDDWFVYVIHREKKSGKERKALIIAKDVECFKKTYLDIGWIIASEEETIKKPVKVKKTKKK